MTIDEMIEELQRRRDMHGGQTPVRATCESVVREINPDNIYYAPWGDDPTLWIDADENFYKPDDAV
jgi:hypothetical protein